MVDLDRVQGDQRQPRPCHRRRGVARHAERLRAAVREVDTVARVGGDEFVVVLRRWAAPLMPNAWRKSWSTGIREPMRVLGMPIECSASVGVALFGGGELTSAELMRRADLRCMPPRRPGATATGCSA
jgi:diguanylate cyclase (GGDEF)-like protein